MPSGGWGREHDPEKWSPVFRQDHAQIKKCSATGSIDRVALRPEGEGLELSVLRGLVVRRRRAVAVLPHERVELFLVLGVAQAAEEILELLLLLLQTAQRLAAIFVKGAVATGGRAEAEAAEA